MEKIKILIFIFFLNIKSNFCIVVIPFKTYQLEDEGGKTMKALFESWRQNIIYTNISIGTPSQKITMTIDSNSYITNLFQHYCDIPISLYNSSESNSFKIRQAITYFPMVKASIISETVYFYNDLQMTELKAYELFKIIYSENKKEDQSYTYQYHNFTCINVGLKLNENRELEKNINLINQLAQNFKESYDFTFKYTSDNEGMIIIGAEPHVYEEKTYNSKDYRTAKAIDIDSQDYRDWHLTFEKIYCSYKDKTTGNVIDKTLNETKKIRIKFDLGIIYGSTDYKTMIKDIFFDKLIEEGKCFEHNYELETVYYCDKNQAGEIIKNEFPSLYFKNNEFDKIFELNYKDLFREYNDKIYFLVIFSQSPQKFFEIGKIFLKKYTFTFNQDTKLIGYYIKAKNSDPEQPKEKGGFLPETTFVIVISCLVIVFGVIGFFVGKLVYDKIRKKRMNELDDLYEYKPEEEETNDSYNNNNNSSTKEKSDEGDHLGINEEENIN